MEKGFGWLFDSQASCSLCLLISIHLLVDTLRIRKVISFSSQGRDHAIDLIISAIRSAIQYCASHDTLTSKATNAKKSTPKDKQNKADVHESDTVDMDELGSELKGAVVAAFGSARAAFDVYSKDGVFGKKEWKRLLKRVLPSLKQAEAKLLRKGLPNRMSLLQFCSFIGGSEGTGTSTDKGKTNKSKEADSSGLASLPPEVPEVCPPRSLLFRVD